MASIEAVQQQGIASMFGDPRYSDLIIECEGKQWKVHKVVICSQSPVLSAEVDKGWKESTTGVIVHEEFDADTVDCMLQFMYKQDYDVDKKTAIQSASLADNDKSSKPKDVDQDMTASDDVQQHEAYAISEKNKQLIQHVKVFGIADFYTIPTLKFLAQGKFDSHCREFEAQELRGMAHVVEAIHRHVPARDDFLHSLILEHVDGMLAKNATDEHFMHTLANSNLLQGFAVKLLGVAQKARTQAENVREAQAMEIEDLHKQLKAEKKRIDKAGRAQEAFKRACQTIIEIQVAVMNRAQVRCTFSFGESETCGAQVWTIGQSLLRGAPTAICTNCKEPAR